MGGHGSHPLGWTVLALVVVAYAHVILELAAAGTPGGGAGGARPSADARVLVVTDDRELRLRLMDRGARTAPVAWLLGRLDLPTLAATAPGNRRAAVGAGRPPGGQPGRDGAPSDDDVRPGWKPGRGATAKTGPAHKVARHRRHPKRP